MTNWNQSLAKDSHIELIRVIGGGPAGLIFALLNAHEKHKIVIHEKLDLDQLLNQSRALALSASSIDILKKINIDPKKNLEFIPINKIHTSQKESFGRVIIDQGESDPVGFVIRYAHLIKNLLDKDVESIFQGDPAAKSYAEVTRSYPGFFAIASHRIAHELHKLNISLIPRMISELSKSRTGIDIHPGAKIGEYFSR